MDDIRKLAVLAVGLLVAGCGGGGEAAPNSGDPGQAGTMFGTKMGGLMLLSPTESVQVFGTAAAVQREDQLHLFLIPDKAAQPAFSRAYLSVWVPGTTWSPGVFDATTEDLGAKMEFVTLDGRAYELDLTRDPPVGDLRIDIFSASAAPDGSHSYLTGTLQARLASKMPGQGPVDAAFDIDVPDPQ